MGCSEEMLNPLKRSFGAMSEEQGVDQIDVIPTNEMKMAKVVRSSIDGSMPTKDVSSAKEEGSNECCIFYDPAVTSNAETKMKIDSLLSKFDGVLLKLKETLPSDSVNDSAMYDTLRKKLSEDHSSIICCLNDLGVLSAYEAAKVCLENILNDREEWAYRESSSQRRYFLEQAIFVFNELLPPDYAKLPTTGGYVTPKIQLLVQTLESFRADQVPCFIFVENSIAAKVISRLIRIFLQACHFKVSILTEEELQRETLGSLKVDILVTTDAVMEGVDVPDCSTVIRFDLPKTASSYLHSRKQTFREDFKHITMLERGNSKQIDEMFSLICNEFPMIEEEEAITITEKNEYRVEATGASVSLDSSIGLINRYCQKLGDKPSFENVLSGQFCRCKLTISSNAAFQTITGPESLNSREAKKLVCLEACKKLHELGALNDHLLPAGTKPSKKDLDLHSQVSTSGAGTTKRKELHGTTHISGLAGTWGEGEDEHKFYAYKLEFCSSDPEVHYSNFVLLIESKLDDDVGNLEVELYLLKRKVTASVSPVGQICLVADQVAKAKRFHEFFFNGLFGKLFTNVSGERTLIFHQKESLWDESYMYLLLPLASPEPISINWNGIESSVSTVEFLKEKAWFNAKRSEANRRNSLLQRNDSDVMDVYCSNVIHLANKSVSGEGVRGMVVVAIHTGRIYTVLEAESNSSAESPFECYGDEVSSYSSYADYFQKRYGIVLMYPKQPLLLLKQSHNAHNLLEDFRNLGLSLENKSDSSKIKPQQHAHIPPELLICIDIDADELRSFYLLPSLMHRLQCLMLASQLRREISSHYGDSNIPSSLILEALTTPRCNESISMERLELLGDSVLKYTMSCHLFLKYRNADEGELSSMRRWAICNSTLHELGVSRNIQEYVIDYPFIPRVWTAPGQRSIWPSPCNHGVGTSHVPLDRKLFRDDEKVELGRCCDRGHRWIVSKTVSDTVESLVGAYYLGGGLIAAIKVMKWIGMDVDLNMSRVEDTVKAASLHSYTPSIRDIESLESKLGYKFSVKGLLLEAITHKTKQENYCYERLEFLGDAVLDLLITKYLFLNHTDVDQGELTDLRSASVNNVSFGTAAVRENLHPHLQLCSAHIERQISAFEKSVSKSSRNSELLVGGNFPKELGDLVESITGAILIDTKLDISKVWEIIAPLLSPIVTPDNLELPPYRELIELCGSLGYFFKQNWKRKGEKIHVEISLQLDNDLLVKEGIGPCRKDAKGQAALLLLKELKNREISSKSNRPEIDRVAAAAAGDNLLSANSLNSPHDSNANVPEIPPIDMKKGGPRTSLFSLCRTLQWPMPTIDPLETKSKTLIEFGSGDGMRTSFNTFESRITLRIPNVGVIELMGEKQPDKKSSSDSAALALLFELERQGKIKIRKE